MNIIPTCCYFNSLKCFAIVTLRLPNFHQLWAFKNEIISLIQKKVNTEKEGETQRLEKKELFTHGSLMINNIHRLKKGKEGSFH